MSSNVTKKTILEEKQKNEASLKKAEDSDTENVSNHETVDDNTANEKTDEDTPSVTYEVKTSKSDAIADQIIKAFIVKKRQMLINQDDPLDNITYEESEQRLIFMGISLATFLGLLAMIFSILTLKKHSSLQQSSFQQSIKTESMTYLRPYVTFMDLLGNGHIFTLKQNENLTFNFDWEFKVSKTKGLPCGQNSVNCNYQQYQNTGYFLFEDKKNLFVISTSMDAKITMINSPNSHVTLKKSQIIGPFYISGSILRVGNFAMVFGGMLKDPFQWELLLESGCSTPYAGVTQDRKTVIWSTKRQVWIQGPLLPKRPDDCMSIATGFAVNRTVGVVLKAPNSNMNRCVHAYTFCFETFDWVDVNDCLVDTKEVIEVFTSMQCTTYFDRSLRL